VHISQLCMRAHFGREQVAIKVEPIQPKVESNVAYEYTVYSKLQGIIGFPTIKYV
jgi:hypothetical protein